MMTGSERSVTVSRSLVCVFVAILGSVAFSAEPRAREGAGLQIINGWFTQDGSVIWGAAQHNGWWGGYRKSGGWISQYKVRTALCRRDPERVGPSFTEDLELLTGAMIRYGYPGFEHNYGLWYDRRRDAHDITKRTDANVQPPFLEQPWSRSGEGTAWDGLTRYDLRKFNGWYFDRLKTFAQLCEAKGAVLFHNFYMQHALLESPAHYVDFPWRSANCMQATEMPDALPAANAFYDLTNATRRDLHRTYIRKCLDELGDCSNVIHFVSQEYTGPLSFMQFWMDTVLEWEQETGATLKIGLVGTRDVVDAILADPVRGPRISTICLSYWWYNADGTLHAPPGGQEVAGRYTGQLSQRTSPESLYRQIREYRLRYPDKALIQHHSVELKRTWAFLTGGGSMIIAGMQYPDSAPPRQPWEPPKNYIAPAEAAILQPTYDFIRTYLAKRLTRMKPADGICNKGVWSLADPGKDYLCFTPKGGALRIDLSGAGRQRFAAHWFDPRTGALTPAGEGRVTAGSSLSLETPDAQCWALWLSRENNL